MTSQQVAALYDALARHRTVLYFSTSLVLLLCVCLAFTSPLNNDIALMIPDNGDLAEDFRLLQLAPLTNKIIINLHAEDETGTSKLEAAAAQLSSVLPGELITGLVDGPQNSLSAALLPWLMKQLPNLLDANDLAKIEELTTKEAIHQAMQRNYRDLLSPQGSALKNIIRSDPLGFNSLLFPKLQALNVATVVQVRGGHFLSEDGRNLLLIAETPIPMSDSDGSARLIAHLEQAFDQISAGITVSYAAGHRHTLVNSQVVQNDIRLALTISTALLGLIFLLFLRRIRALSVFLVPVGALAVALACTRVGFGEISGIVVGFGAVLIGISIDFALHVYFACTAPDSSRGQGLTHIIRPLIFGVLTSLGAFGALLLSATPAIRQLAIFTMSGLACSLLLSVLVLPHLLSDTVHAPSPSPSPSPALPQRLPWWIKLTFALLLLACFVYSLNAHVDGDLRSLGYMNPTIVEEGENIRTIWGAMDDSSLFFTPVRPPEEALRINDAAYASLQQTISDARISSIAPLVPARQTQAARHEAWQQFWTERRKDEVLYAIHEEAERLGFSDAAFAPFKEQITGVFTPATLDKAYEAGLGDLLDLFILPFKDGKQILTIVPPPYGQEPPTVTPLFKLGMRSVSTTSIKMQLEQAVRGDTVRFLNLSAVAVLILLLLLFRNPRLVTAAAFPPLCAALAVTTFSGMTGSGLNLFSITAFPIVLGLCSDYGIYMVYVSLGRTDASTRTATLVSGLTTLAGFGTLALTSHPALNAIGTLVLFGVGAALPAALFITPAIAGSRS